MEHEDTTSTLAEPVTNEDLDGDDPETSEAVAGAKKSKRILTRREKLILAAKARIRRMVQAKKKRTDLATPDWLKQEWEKGTEQKDLMADTLLSLNWDKAGFINEMEKIITSRKRVTVKREVGWYSEAEMKTDLAWSQSKIAGAKSFCTDPSRIATHCRQGA
ncbi:unnamed protein product [Cladocopium goreaui]|uniref:Uncharacterized protein n=1 Tax=Cladocopium goreaui TaxID=2562237 RepID=A0A9P1G6S1_9DINO|nr:unnamed protein product [Cladocopium goreaui]